MKRFLFLFVAAFTLPPSLSAQQTERPQSGCTVPVMIMKAPESQSVCPGHAVSLTALALNVSNRTWEMSTDGGLHWFPSIGILRSAISGQIYYDTLTIPIVYNEMSGYMIRCTYYGCGSVSRTPAATLTTYAGTAQVISQPANTVTCVGNTADFSITIAGGSLTYQWQQSTDGGNSFQAIPGENAADLHINPVTAGMNGYRFRCDVTSECGGSITSGAALLTVNNGNTIITEQPHNDIVCGSDTAYFSVAASGIDLQYQWQSSTLPGELFSDIAGAITNSLAIPNSIAGTSYRCKITSNCGTLFSQSVYANKSTDPEFNMPSPVFACTGDLVHISGIIANDQLFYQWMVSTDSGVTYSNITGEIAPVLAVSTNASNNGYRYKCFLNGACFSGYSNVTIVYSNPVQLAVTYQTPNQNACVGTPTTLFVNATGPTDSYNWEISYNNGSTFTNISFSDNIHSSMNGALSIIPATPGNFQYRCRINGKCSPAIYSAPILLSVAPKPVITGDTSLYVSCDTCKMNVLNAFDTTGIRAVDLYIVQDNFSTAFLRANPDSAGIGRYRLWVQNAGGCRAVSDILVGIRKFDTLKACPGTAATFSSSITGNQYQWQVNIGNGNGFQDITDYTAGISYDFVSGAQTNTLNIHAIQLPSLVRCKVNGNQYSDTFFVSVPAYWTGAVSNAWEDPYNWSCGIPNAASDVYIPNNVPRMPQINSSNNFCRTLAIAEGASVVIKSGMNVYVNDYFRY